MRKTQEATMQQTKSRQASANSRQASKAEEQAAPQVEEMGGPFVNSSGITGISAVQATANASGPRAQPPNGATSGEMKDLAANQRSTSD